MDVNENRQYWALVLGASSGFGEATSLKLSEEGYNIIGVHLDRQATMPNVDRIRKQIAANGSQSMFFNVNAADQAKREEIIAELKEKFHRPAIKILMHSLAFGALKAFIPHKGEQGLTKSQMEMTLDVMAHSLVYWTQDLISNGLFAKKGRIFAMTSSGSHTIIPFYGAVSAAKASLESHVRQLAYELGDYQIAVNAIMAGVTDTPALRKIPGSVPMIEVAKRKNPNKRLTTPQDVANVIALLCREGGQWISGGLVHADGGEDIVSYVGQGEPLKVWE